MKGPALILDRGSGPRPRCSAYARGAAALVFALVAAGCVGDEPSSPESLARPTGHETGGTELILLGVDGATFHVMDGLASEGVLPNLSRLRREGVSGTMESERPLRSPPIWTTLATGRMREDHGIESFFVERPDGAKIPVTTQMRTARPFWDIFSAQGISTGVVAWWPSWPADAIENGFVIADRAWPIRFSPNAVPYGSRRDSQGRVDDWDFARRTWPEELWGEFEPYILTEEGVMNEDYSQVLFGGRFPIEQEMWNAFWVFAKDHTFVRSGTHFLATRRPRVFALYLQGVDVLSHYYWHYRAEEGFRIAEPKRKIYGEVLERYYQYVDHVVGGLLEAAGEGVAIMVVSDHGFQTFDDLKVRWERGETVEHGGGKGGYPFWHNTGGVFMAAGPGFASGVTLEKASIYDVMPTLLHRMGLPVAGDMPGRVIDEAFAPDFMERNPPRTVETWETGEAVEVGPLDASPVDGAIMEKLRSLGYVD